MKDADGNELKVGDFVTLAEPMRIALLCVETSVGGVPLVAVGGVGWVPPSILRRVSTPEPEVKP